MTNNSFLAFLLIVVMVLGCVGAKMPAPVAETTKFDRAEGDSTVYALVAAGSNDSILVFLELPYDGTDPDTVDILDALRQRRFYGRPQVGDNVAIVRSDSDSTVAECVIVTERLADRWRYNVYPHLRRKLSEGPLPPHLQKMLEEPREYGMTFKLGGTMLTKGAQLRPSDDQLPVVYPQAKNYGLWAIFNGRLVLSEVKRDTTGVVTVLGTDTADFVRMGRDTLILRFNDGERRFYRKEEASE